MEGGRSDSSVVRVLAQLLCMPALLDVFCGAGYIPGVNALLLLCMVPCRPAAESVGCICVCERGSTYICYKDKRRAVRAQLMYGGGYVTNWPQLAQLLIK